MLDLLLLALNQRLLTFNEAILAVYLLLLTSDLLLLTSDLLLLMLQHFFQRGTTKLTDGNDGRLKSLALDRELKCFGHERIEAAVCNSPLKLSADFLYIRLASRLRLPSGFEVAVRLGWTR